MDPSPNDTDAFHARFLTRAQALHYRDRYVTGRRARIDGLERAALRRLLRGIGPLAAALDLPSGTGRLSPVLGEFASRVVLADASPEMLQLAREDLPTLSADYVLTDAERIDLPDGSVDLAFSHRFLHHIHTAATRMRIFRELARVSRRYVVLSYYTPGFRDRFRWWKRRLLSPAKAGDRPALRRQFLDEVAAAGFKLRRTETLRRFPLRAMFCLFERV
jgi:SAM-dependent methyltransferase